ncbi:17918_t:CDS:2 [Funneliformis geosporum]|uniref:3314_t:CDS:1 n=1 Tax=Funneliformis geosporum TaxID=1117311 RepID=A0A9W4WPB3_9GLOM|nr:3314_t:CDS:2 [Funneliformis geosporum]CAI2168194.1 17918_t:CDS:2 [Funneliformis geosporum]
MSNNNSIRRHRRVDKVTPIPTIATTSTPLLPLSPSPTIAENLIVAKMLDELKTSMKDQEHLLLNKEKESPIVKKLFEKIFDRYSDIKTILTLPELLAPATNSRAKGTPRPQNGYILFRKDVSKGLYMLNHKNGLKGSCMDKRSRNVNYSSKIAGFLWRSVKLSQHEHGFWMILCQIVCLKHSETYENYVYRPIRKKPNDIDGNSFPVTELQKSKNVATLETSPSSNHPSPVSILESDINETPSYNDNSFEQSQTTDFHASDMSYVGGRPSTIVTSESALITRHITRSITDQGRLINQQRAQQEHHKMISQEAEVPMISQGTAQIQPRRRSNAQYPSPTIINQPTEIMTQKNTTAQFEFATAAPQFVETTVLHSTYATYTANSQQTRLPQFIGPSDLTLSQIDHYLSTGLTQQYYQQFANPYAVTPENAFAPMILPPQQMIFPSTPIMTMESQQNTISGTSFSNHQQHYLQYPSSLTVGADPQFCYPPHDELVFLSQIDGSGSDPLLLHQSDSYETRE